ncbi:protoheme IX farnesyltransferase [Longibacter salinarum]|uniref:Protoheme IX farnesyltransferase n=1 Tax=Longibacter salinarum TaxID=1850348 RepID=A0A2A8D0Y7_9BACT|nr:heme o synthase [Longibacter salinarum]PEN14551.1 protoheme IX farnesyltransferase [Longibacter salinarum]
MSTSDIDVSPRETPAAVARADRPVHSAVATEERTWQDVLRDYLELTKPEISFLVTVSALAGFLLGSPDSVDLLILGVTLVGTALCAGGVGMLNHVIEERYDAQMKRTANRPIPDGRISASAARPVGITMVCVGVAIICPIVNPLTALLAMVTAVLYVYVYTPLKRTTKWNTVIGTIPGALPALGGYTAATGDLGAGGWAIFAILAFWQMPHFLSLAWMYRKDYARGNYAMLPVLEPGGTSTAVQMIGSTVLLCVASVTPFVYSTAGWLYLAVAAPLGIWFLWTTIDFARAKTGQAARRVLKASIVYIPVLVAAIGIDWLVA